VFVLLRAQTLSLSLSLPFYRTAPDFVWKETKQKQRGREKERERNKNSKLFSRFFFFFPLTRFLPFFLFSLTYNFPGQIFFSQGKFSSLLATIQYQTKPHVSFCQML